MGTPHRGTGEITSKGKMLVAIASHASLRVNDTVLRALEYGNDILMDILNEFVSICQAPGVDISLFCFFEQRITNIGKLVGDQVIEVSLRTVPIRHIVTLFF